MNKSILTLFLALNITSANALADASVLCQRDAGNQLSFSRSISPRQSNEFIVLNWNTHKLKDKNFMPDLIRLAREADVVTLQEAMHSEKYENLFANAVPYEFSFHKSFCNKQNAATGVMNMARLPLTDNLTLVSPDTEPILHTPKVSGYSLVRVDGLGDIHLINTHALNFNLGSKFERHINSIAKFIATKQGPVIWVGDFNTWNRSRMNHLMKVTQQLGLRHHAPANDNRNLKLDHFFTRGLNVTKIELLNEYKSSDHKPLRLTIQK